jgi:hypothetical protein
MTKTRNGFQRTRKEDIIMPKITLDATLSGKLQELAEVAELCDPSGRVIGRFIPLVDMSEWEPVSPDVSEEKLDRRERSNEKRYTTAEVLAYLEKL